MFVTLTLCLIPTFNLGALNLWIIFIVLSFGALVAHIIGNIFTCICTCIPMADGVCRNSDPTNCIDKNPLGQEDVGVCILYSLYPLGVLPSSMVDAECSSRRCQLVESLPSSCGIQQDVLATLRPRKGRRKYDSVHVPREPTQYRQDETVGETSITSVATKDCCGEKYCQLFPRDKIKPLRQKIWLADFRMRSAKKLEVHHNMHFDELRRKVMTLENIEVCCKAWYIIHVVSKVDFYRFRNYSS